MNPCAELDAVQLQKDYLECGLAAGALATVVLVHAQGEAYEVEFIGLDGHTQAVLTCPPLKWPPSRSRGGRLLSPHLVLEFP